MSCNHLDCTGEHHAFLTSKWNRALNYCLAKSPSISFLSFSIATSSVLFFPSNSMSIIAFLLQSTLVVDVIRSVDLSLWIKRAPRHRIPLLPHPPNALVSSSLPSILLPPLLHSPLRLNPRIPNLPQQTYDLRTRLGNLFDCYYLCDRYCREDAGDEN